jgi:enoyl-CoA hydratase/carnithine racemase
MCAKFERFIDEFEADDDLWVGIIASSHESVFCAGADLKAINRGEQIGTKKGGFAGLVQYPRTKPLIAAVDGKALAGGGSHPAPPLVVALGSSRRGLKYNITAVLLA